jgi:putative peptidoglycan lipid II flippase
VVLIPGLSALQARGDHEGYSGHLDWGLRLVALLALPCAVAMLVFAKPMVAVLFHYGRFSPEAVDMTVLALRGYGVGLLGLIGVKVLAPGFFAQQDLRTPVRIAVVVLACTQLMNLVFVPWLGHAGLACPSAWGPWSTRLAAVRPAGPGLYRASPGWPLFLLRLLPANLGLGLWLGWTTQAVDWLAWRSHALLRAGAGRGHRRRRGDLLRPAVAGGAAAPHLSAASLTRAPPGLHSQAMSLPMRLEAPSALEYFAALVADDAHFPLLEAAALLGQDAEPGLDVQAVIDEVDRLGQRFCSRLPADASALHRLRMLNRYFFHELGFGGNANNFYDPQNSYLHRVLETRRGIPVSLAVLYIELATQAACRPWVCRFRGTSW